MNKAVDTELTDDERDALTELINLGVGRAALSLRNLLNEEISLTVPRLEIVNRQEAIALVADTSISTLVAVHQAFSGDITGQALLIFPENNSLEIVRSMVGADMALDEVLALEKETLAEVGNVVLNGCLATIANQLERTLKISLPEVITGDSKRLFNLPVSLHEAEVVLFVHIQFSARMRNIVGYMALMTDKPSMTRLRDLLTGYIRRTVG